MHKTTLLLQGIFPRYILKQDKGLESYFTCNIGSAFWWGREQEDLSHYNHWTSD